MQYQARDRSNMDEGGLKHYDSDMVTTENSGVFLSCKVNAKIFAQPPDLVMTLIIT